MEINENQWRSITINANQYQPIENNENQSMASIEKSLFQNKTKGKLIISSLIESKNNTGNGISTKEANTSQMMNKKFSVNTILKRNKDLFKTISKRYQLVSQRLEQDPNSKENLIKYREEAISDLFFSLRRQKRID